LHGGINSQTLQEIKSKNPKFFFCYKEDQLIAGVAVVLESENRFRLFLNSSDHDYLKYQPNNLLYWHLIKWGKENKYEIFDLGGYQLETKPNDKLYSVNRFKERWGGRVVKYPVYSYNPFYILGRKLIKKSRLFRVLWNKIKGRPKPSC
jgi:lipid II:glycine glycyltransferase (peptidoglycan interpeptide bridge formation enzyme)